MQLWTLDNLCGIQVDPGQKVEMDVKLKRDLDRIQRAIQRLPVDVTDRDNRKRDWLFNRYDIGKSGRLVLAAANNMIHVQYLGAICQDVTDVIRHAFRAAKKLSTTGDSECIFRPEFRLFLIALRSHLELFIVFSMIDVSRDFKLTLDEFRLALPLLKKWGVNVDDPEGLFEMIDKDHSGEISFAEFVDWALKEAIIADLELREKNAQHINKGDSVLLLGEHAGLVGKVVGWDRATKKWIVELEDGTRIIVGHDQMSNGSAVNDVLPKFKDPEEWFEALQKENQPGTDHPWIKEEPIIIKSEWSNRPGEFCIEIRCVFMDDNISAKQWAYTVREAKIGACKKMRLKISAHPGIKKVLKLVNSDLAGERGKDGSRKEELLSERMLHEKRLKEYRGNIWRRRVIGKQIVDTDTFTKIVRDCGVKLQERELRLIYRHIIKQGNGTSLKIKFEVANQFILEGKYLDAKLKGFRQKFLKQLNKKKWNKYVEESKPENADAARAKFDELHPQVKEKKFDELEKLQKKSQGKRMPTTTKKRQPLEPEEHTPKEEDVTKEDDHHMHPKKAGITIVSSSTTLLADAEEQKKILAT
eukprot:UN32246